MTNRLFLNVTLTLAFLLSACGGAPVAELTVAATEAASPTAARIASTATPEPTPAPTSIPVTPVAQVTWLPTGTDGYPWWNDTVFYEIFVRSFYDSNSDGIGDLNGVTAKLDYLNDGDPNTTTDLGVTGLWLMPIQPAASYHGYDVTDYYAVNADYGTLDDFKRLLAEAHKRGIRVLVDWVPNHTSDQHPWFQAARDPGSPYRDWYVWSPEGKGSGWRRSVGGDYYYGFFSEHMPDLNYTNQAVTEQMHDAARFWLSDVGVDGFRIDAVKYLIEDKFNEHTDATHAWFKDFRKFYQDINPQALMIGEIWDSSGLVLDYTGGDELDLGFDFDLANALVLGAGVHNTNQINTILPRDAALFRPGQFATFLTNHDQNRVMSAFGGDVEKAKNAATLLLTAPGVPFLYYGEEIGLLGKKPDEDIRLPMQWTGGANGGFTAGRPWRALNADYATKNVAAQTDHPDSLLSHYRALIALRNNHAALRVGDFYLVTTNTPGLFASVRATKDEIILVIVNMSRETLADYRLSLDSGPLAAGEYLAAPLLAGGPFAALAANARGGFDSYQPLPELPPNVRIVVQLQLQK